ncbi:hypothetical protein AVEN_130662-1 [Araneus ventricosus]|uniref:Uncharacterized protein n=1 Tax=Araneus ventricosus TaxID=182803 RepID=A0A4Y2R276_ARAVE|nr:hypothetical protein AVEN_130662-1 [Araneus ventricosus]
MTCPIQLLGTFPSNRTLIWTSFSTWQPIGQYTPQRSTRGLTPDFGKRTRKRIGGLTPVDANGNSFQQYATCGSLQELSGLRHHDVVVTRAFSFAMTTI